MSGSIAAIVRCGRHVRHVYETVQRLEGQQGDPVRVVLVSDASTPARWRDWLTSFAGARGHSLVHSEGDTPGTVMNDGVRSSTATHVICLDAGDRLDWDALQVMRLSAGGAPAVLAGVVQVSVGGARRVIRADRQNLDGLVASTDAGELCWLIARSAWEAVGGFDGSLSALENYDFALSLAGQSGRLGTIRYGERAVLTRSVRTRAPLDQERYSQDVRMAMAAIVLKHRALFDGRIGPALYERQRRLPILRQSNRTRMDRREQTLAEIAHLQDRLAVARAALPEAEHDVIDAQWTGLRRTTPLSRQWGYERGGPLDRHYIESFLNAHAADIQGRVLEIQEPDYTDRFGGNRVTRSDVVDADDSNLRATIVSDLRAATNIGNDLFDCIILTQTLHVIDDMTAAVSECARILKPGGVLLATLPCASRVCVEYGPDGDAWRVTAAGARHLFNQAFDDEHVDARPVGGIAANIGFLSGMSARELTPAELAATDPYFPLIVTVRAIKPRTRTRSQAPLRCEGAAVILLHHRVADETIDAHELAVPAGVFRDELRYLAANCHVMPLQDILDAMASGSVDRRSVALTFDDGYADNFEIVSPLLLEFDLPATFFITTHALRTGNRTTYWWDTLELALLAPGTRSVEPLTVDLPGGHRVFPTHSQEERERAHWTIYHAIVGLGVVERDAVIDAVAEWRGSPIKRSDQRRRMSRDEVAELARRPGHAIGAHSVHHLLLPQQTVEIQRAEIETSRRDLEALVQRPVLTFAYPFGAFDEATVAAVKGAGIAYAVTCEQAALAGATDDPLTLPRFTVTRACAARFNEWMHDAPRYT